MTTYNYYALRKSIPNKWKTINNEFDNNKFIYLISAVDTYYIF